MLSLYDSTIQGCSAQSGGAVAASIEFLFSLVSLTVLSFLWFVLSSSMFLYNSILSGNSAVNGGALVLLDQAVFRVVLRFVLMIPYHPVLSDRHC